MEESWETPPHFRITERQQGFTTTWGVTAVSPMPGLALQETSAHWDGAAPHVDTSPGFLFVNSARGFLQPIW